MTGRTAPGVWALTAMAVMLLSVALLAPQLAPLSAPAPLEGQAVLQPALKRNVYVFLDRFLDRTNATTPAQILAKLDAVDAYFSEVTHGAWTFNWTLFYPTLGQPWYTVNETYAQAGASSDLTPLAEVITQAYDAGVRYPAPGTYPLVTSGLIIHAGNDGAMTANATDIWSVTTGPYCSGLATNPPNAFCLLTAIVAETDPVGVIAHELTHELERFDESGNPMGITLGHSAGALPSGMVPVDWWDPMYQGLRNPTNNASVAPGSEPSEFMAWNRMSLGLLPLSQIAVVGRGQSATVTLNDLEEATSGVQAVRIPVGNDSQSRWYYMVELRKGTSYDAYFPWLTTIFPDRMGMLVYWINVSTYGTPFQIFLMKAHPGDVTAQQALFGNCSAPCASAMSFEDAANAVNVTITATGSSAWVVRVSNAGSSSAAPPAPSGPSPPGTAPSAVTCPGVGCFLGFVNLGSWGLWLNALLVVEVAVGMTAAGIQRKRAKRARGVSGPYSRGEA